MITPTTNPLNYSLPGSYIPFESEDNPGEEKTSQPSAYILSLSVNTNTSIEITTYNNNALAQRSPEQVNKAASSDEARQLTTVELKEKIRLEVENQFLAQLKKFIDENPEMKEMLFEFYSNNPEALQKVAGGEIPEYFNVDNTAKRILDIYFSQYDGGDRQEFVDRAKGIIKQAYSEVEGQFDGGLPSIVYATRDKIMEILDKFAAGEDISDFISIPNLVNELEEA